MNNKKGYSSHKNFAQTEELSEEKEQKEYKQFVFRNITKGIIWLIGILAIYWLGKMFLPMQWEQYIESFSDRTFLIFSIFFASETFFGIIPLEFFVIWARDQAIGMYILYVFILSVLSYLGAIISYGGGLVLKRTKLLKRVREWDSFQHYSSLYRRWGGIIIIIAALTPIPFATISFLSASFGFPFSRYLLYSSTRFLRFIFLGVLLWLIT